MSGDAIREVRPARVADRVDAYRVVDVREPSEFHGPLGHIEGAEPVPLGELESQLESEIEGRLDALASGGPLLLVCRSGNRSGHACRLLARHGIAGATNLAGGMIEWHEAGLPVVREHLADPRAVLEAFAVWLSQVRRMPRAEAEARVREGLPAGQGSALSAEAVAGALETLARGLRADAPAPADLELVCRALRSDLDALAERQTGDRRAGA